MVLLLHIRCTFVSCLDACLNVELLCVDAFPQNANSFYPNCHVQYSIMLSHSIMEQCVATPAGLSLEEASPGAMSASGGTTSARWVLACCHSEFKSFKDML